MPGLIRATDSAAEATLELPTEAVPWAICDLVQDQMAGIAVELFVVQFHVVYSPRPSNRAVER